MVRRGAASLYDNPVAFNTTIEMRKGVGVSNFGPLTPARKQAIEEAGRAELGPAWKLVMDPSWIVAQRDQGGGRGDGLYQDNPSNTCKEDGTDACARGDVDYKT